MTKRLVFISAFLMIAITLCAYSQERSWKIVRQAGMSVDFNDVFFVGTQNGWAIGKDGAIIHTGDSGKTWNAQKSNTKKEIHKLCFVDEQNGWAVGADGLILNTADGGQTWKPQPIGTQKWLFSVCFVNKNMGWVAGDGGTIFHTKDGGKT